MASIKKTVLITGCSPGGIGHALAEEFHAKGLRVFATARSQTVLEELSALGIETLALDVTSPASIKEVKSEVESRTGGGLDYLVNNAGRNYTVPALDVDFDQVRQTFETNVFGVMRMCQEFAPLLIRSKGTIVQIGSVAGVIPYVFGSAYNASKAALHSYSDSLRIELAPFGVNVTTVITGGVQSRIAREDRVLPPTSLYHPINAAYTRRQKHSQENAMSNTAYAQSVVGTILSSSPAPPPRYIWEGAKVWIVWAGYMFFPKSIWDFLFKKMFGLEKLERLSSQQQQQENMMMEEQRLRKDL